MIAAARPTAEVRPVATVRRVAIIRRRRRLELAPDRAVLAAESGASSGEVGPRMSGAAAANAANAAASPAAATGGSNWRPIMSSWPPDQAPVHVGLGRG